MGRGFSYVVAKWLPRETPCAYQQQEVIIFNKSSNFTKWEIRGYSIEKSSLKDQNSISTSEQCVHNTN